MKPVKLILLLLFLFLILSVLYLFGPTSLKNEEIRIVVNPDEQQSDITTSLKKQNLIRSDKFFPVLLGIMYFPGKIEPGAYLVNRNMTAISLAQILLFHPYQKWLTIAPGNRDEQIAEKLKKTFNWDEAKAKEFIKDAREGYMFPDTYLLNVDYTPADMAKKFLNNFNEHFTDRMQKDLLAQDVRNDTAVKIASLIERESGGPADKALIAGIIWNRLDKGMKLQIDATIQYVLGTTGNWWPGVKGSDMKTESLYNTYLYKGLPPGPIANPSLDSISAAIYPEETDCLFYLHSPDKAIHCAVTYEDHLENIEKYLK